jgi:hypothetical protein
MITPRSIVPRPFPHSKYTPWLVVVPHQLAGSRTRKYFKSRKEAQDYCDRLRSLDFQEADTRHEPVYEIVPRVGTGANRPRSKEAPIEPSSKGFVAKLNRILEKAGASRLNERQSNALRDVYPRF